MKTFREGQAVEVDIVTRVDSGRSAYATGRYFRAVVGYVNRAGQVYIYPDAEQDDVPRFVWPQFVREVQG